MFNSRSLRNKTTQVLELLLEQNTDVCCLSETWLRDNDGAIANEIQERGFKMFHNPRKGRGGGTAVLCKSELKFTKQHTRSFKTFEKLSTDNIWVAVARLSSWGESSIQSTEQHDH